MISRSLDSLELNMRGVDVFDAFAQLRAGEWRGRRAEGEEWKGREAGSGRGSGGKSDTFYKVCESDREILSTKVFRLECEFTEEVKSAGGQKATASGGKGFEGSRVIAQEVDDRIGKFGSKVSERHGANGAGKPDGRQLRDFESKSLYSGSKRAADHPNSQQDNRDGNNVAMNDTPQEKRPARRTKRSQCETRAKPTRI